MDLNSKEAKLKLRENSRTEYELLWARNFGQAFEHDQEVHWRVLVDHAFEVEDTDQFVLLKEDAKVLKKKATCAFCKKTGHSESQCYKKKLPPSSTSSNENGNESAKEKKISWKEIKEKNLCIKCLQPGHKKKDCPERSTPKDGCFLLPEEGASADASASSSMEEDKMYKQFLRDVNSPLSVSEENALGPISPPPDSTKLYVPITWGDSKSLDIWTIHDSAVTVTMADSRLWNQLEGEEGQGKHRSGGIGAAVQTLTCFKMVAVYTLFYATVVKVWRNPALTGNRLLIHHEDAKRLGVTVQGIEVVFPSIAHQVQVDDQQWLDDDEDQSQEEQWDDESVKLFIQSIDDALKENQRLQENSHCVLPDSEFKISLKEDTPKFVPQYLIPEKLKGKVME